MKKKDYLFHLIQSMTKAEKRFFKLFCSFQGKPKNYLRLFSVIEKMTEYDEAILVKKINDGKITDNLSVYKNYLYNQILKSLRIHYDNKGVERQLFSLIGEADILIERSLFEPALDRLQKAYKLAEAHHMFALALLILQRKLRTSIRDRQLKLVEMVEDLYQDSLRKMEAFREEFNNALLYRRIFVINRRNKRSKLETMLQGVQKDFDLLGLPKSNSFYARLNYYKCNAYFNFLTKKPEQAFSFFEQIVALWDENPVLLKENTKAYKLDICNLLNSAYAIGKYDIFPEMLKKAAQLSSATWDEEVEAFSNIYFLEIIYCFNTNQFERILALIPTIEEGLQKYGRWITRGRLATFYYNLTVLYIALEDYGQAQVWLNKILHSDRTDVREDIQRIARIFELVIHFELENDRVLEYLFDSALNKLSKEASLYPFEALCFEYLEKLMKAPAKKEQRLLFIEFKECLEKRAFAKQVRGSEEIEIWLESKINGKSFIDVLTDKKP